jgi:hypothetical protein
MICSCNPTSIDLHEHDLFRGPLYDRADQKRANFGLTTPKSRGSITN